MICAQKLAVLAHVLHLLTHLEIATDAQSKGGGPAEDPPFGGLWCDQPALFFASLDLRG